MTCVIFKRNFHSFNFKTLLFIGEAAHIHTNKSLRSWNCTFTFWHAGHSRTRLNDRVSNWFFYQWNLLSKEAAWEVDPNRWSLWCPAAAQLAGGQAAKTKTERNSRQKKKKKELIYPSEAFHRSLSERLVALAAWPQWNHEQTLKWLVHMKAVRRHLSLRSDASVCARDSLHKLTGGRCFFFFVKMTKWCLGGEAEQVRHHFCSAAPSSPASLPICPAAQLSALNERRFVRRLFCLFYPGICLFL